MGAVIHRASIGWWNPDVAGPTCEPEDMRQILADLRSTVVLVHTTDGIGAAMGGVTRIGGPFPTGDSYPLAAFLPPLLPEDLGDPSFCRTYGLRYPYMTGAMANGIASVDIVEAMAEAGMLGSYGAAGQSIDTITQAIDQLQRNLEGRSFAINLIHSPNEPAHEAAVAELLIRKGVRTVEASAYLDMSPAIVHYRAAGLTMSREGILIQNRVIAKVSRTEVATKFLSPAPVKLLQELLKAGKITPQQAELAQKVPMCDDLTAEADSGGHTDNRPAIALLPTMLALRDTIHRQCGYLNPVRVGLAGGIATPASVAAAFSMGAAYVVTGSINQACIESGSSDVVRKMLAEAGQADVAMAPAADMFEIGVKLQVLKRGTMFAMRAQKLYDLYRAYPSWNAIPAPERGQVEKNFFRKTYEEIWAQTQEFFARRDPTLLPKAQADLKVQMALVFRWYLGLSSRWANSGEPTRQLDYQIWCGPAMGAFNEWTKGTSLEEPANRSVMVVALNLLYNGAIHMRRLNLKQQGVVLPTGILPTGPLELDELRTRLD
ncbi:MAG: PfaD family polyunsaturated fatty acid/polyketide biosynthesis protein [Fimbriiglobus sp.]